MARFFCLSQDEMEITEAQYERIKDALPVQRGKCGCEQPASAERCCMSLRKAANGAVCPSGSATGTRSTLA